MGGEQADEGKCVWCDARALGGPDGQVTWAVTFLTPSYGEHEHETIRGES